MGAARPSEPPGAELVLIEPLYYPKEDVVASSLHSHRTRTAHPVGLGGLDTLTVTQLPPCRSLRCIK